LATLLESRREHSAATATTTVQQSGAEGMPITKDVVKFGTFVVTSQVCAHWETSLAAHYIAVT
jgi:hypothetical protein